MTEHEGANWKTLEEITKKREELQRRVNRLILPKQPADITIEDRIDLIRHLILCLYADLPTLRNDYSDAPIIFMRDHRSSAIRKMMQGNHIMETAKGQFTFHLQYFKTDRTHAEKAYTFPTRMNNVVVESLTAFPRRYAQWTKQETDAYFTERLEKLKLKREESGVPDVSTYSTLPLLSCCIHRRRPLCFELI
jgi:hypothetical protein